LRQGLQVDALVFGRAPLLIDAQGGQTLREYGFAQGG
jgi:hypothetical protein